MGSRLYGNGKPPFVATPPRQSPQRKAPVRHAHGTKNRSGEARSRAKRVSSAQWSLYRQQIKMKEGASEEKMRRSSDFQAPARRWCKRKMAGMGVFRTEIYRWRSIAPVCCRSGFTSGFKTLEKVPALESLLHQARDAEQHDRRINHIWSLETHQHHLDPLPSSALEINRRNPRLSWTTDGWIFAQ